MKTAEEVAEKIVTDFMGQTLSTNKDVDDWLQSKIAQAITAYADERVQSALEAERYICPAIAFQLKSEARSDALEEAANLSSVSYSTTDMAMNIRALKK